MSKILFNEKADHKWFSEGEMLQQFSKVRLFFNYNNSTAREQGQ